MSQHRVFSLQEPGEDAFVHIRSFSAADGIGWIRSGWRLFCKRPESWVLMSFLYMILALGIAAIPFFGVLILAFVTPLLIAGALNAAEQMAKESAAEKKKRGSKSKRSQSEEFGASSFAAAKQLFSIFTDEDKLFPILQLCMISVVLVLLQQTLLHVIAGSLLLDTVRVEEMHALQFGQIGIAVIAVTCLYLLVTALFVYAIPLCTLGEATVLGGIYYSYKAVVQNFRPFIVYLIVASIPLLFAILSATLFSIMGLVAAVIAGSLYLPIIINSVYCSYKLTYRWA